MATLHFILLLLYILSSDCTPRKYSTPCPKVFIDDLFQCYIKIHYKGTDYKLKHDRLCYSLLNYNYFLMIKVVTVAPKTIET